MLVLLLALGCGEPRVTGPDAMVGQIVDASGAPLGGLRVETLETFVVTDTEGRFAIRYKDPDRHVNWTTEQVHWRRLYRPADQGEVVRIALPEMLPRRMHCSVTCEYALDWAFADGLTARLTGRCVEGEDHSLGTVPTTVPEASCLRPASVPTIVPEDGDLRLLPPAATLRIEIESTDEARVAHTCEVRVGDQPARPDGQNVWVGEVYGPAVVSALCDGLPVRPVAVDRDTGTVRLSWSAHGPRLDLERLAPWASVLEIAAADGAWSMRLAPSEQGIFRLPPLDAGRYTVVVEGTQSTQGRLPWPEAREGVLVVAAEGEQLVGLLHTDTDVVDGLIPVDSTAH